jgi:hypothetical protein
MIMKRELLTALLTMALLAGSAAAADDIPKPFSFSRYQAMLKQSPFAVATAAAAPAATPDFAKDLFIANAAHSSDGDLVTLGSTTDNNFKKYLTTKEAVDGYSISHIDWSDRVGETKVTIKKDGQFATLAFNQALLSQPLPRAPAVVHANPSGRSTQPATRIQPAPIPMLPTPSPRVRGVISRNPATQYITPPPPTPQVPPPEVD